MQARFDGRVVLITGAASGIGAATARRFASEGARLALGDVDGDKLSGFAKELEGGGSDVYHHRVDVADRAQVEAFTEAALERFGRLDVVFNNAGIGGYGRLPDLDPEVWHRTIDVDLHGVFYGCRAASSTAAARRSPTCATPGAARSSTPPPSRAWAETADSPPTTPPRARW